MKKFDLIFSIRTAGAWEILKSLILSANNKLYFS